MLHNVAENRWWPLFHDLTIDTWGGSGYVPRATPESLDAFEAEVGAPLPPSYRDFAVLFGPGQLAGLFKLRAPVGTEHQNADLRPLNAEWRQLVAEQGWYLQGAPDPAHLRRLLFFCETDGGNDYCWDPRDGSAHEEHEYPVRFKGRLERETEVVASSFFEFVSDYCFVNGAQPDWFDDPETNPDLLRFPRNFQPERWLERHPKPADHRRADPRHWCQRWRDVSDRFASVVVDPAWLQRGERTALRIAYRIFESDAFEDMPILADALEDAGCDQEPLLSHMRQDGWHLRNCWAMKLLFEAE
jgi:SMI1 / KNR4 family (SUKH-1)